MPGLSEFVRNGLRLAWRQLFNPASPAFLPDVLRPHIEPLLYDGPSPSVTVIVDDEEVRDSACASPGSDPNPIATSQPLLRVMQARISGLYALTSSVGDLRFSDAEPELTATLVTGKLRGNPLALKVDTTAAANYEFAIDCCVPVSGDSRQCGSTKWTAKASGKFNASIREAKIEATLRTTFTDQDDLILTVTKVKLNVEQSGIDVDFNIAGLDEDFAALADQAVQSGIAGGTVEKVLQNHLDSADFRATLGRILTEQLRQNGLRARA